MFENGIRYQFRMLTDGEDDAFEGTVAAYEHPLLRLEDTPPHQVGVSFGGEEMMIVGSATPTPGLIINVTSPSFVSAQRLNGD